MGARLRLRTPTGAGAKPAAPFQELDGIRARLVRTQATRRQEVDEFLAASARSMGIFASCRAGAFSGGFAIQSAGRTAAARPPVFSVAQIRRCSPRSPACIAALFGVASIARAPRTAARLRANTPPI